MRFEVRHSEVWLVPVLLQSAHVMLVMPMCSLSHKRTRGRRHANEKMEKTPPHRPAAFLTQKPLVASQHPRSFLDPKGGDMGYATQRQSGEVSMGMPPTMALCIIFSTGCYTRLAQQTKTKGWQRGPGTLQPMMLRHQPNPQLGEHPTPMVPKSASRWHGLDQESRSTHATRRDDGQ